MFRPVFPITGQQPFNDWFVPDTVQRMPLGQRVVAVDQYWGGGEFIYTKSNDVIVKGSFCGMDENYTATLTPNTANTGGCVGVAMAPMAAGVFGWLQIQGVAVYKTNATVAAGAPIGIGAAGVGGANSAGKQLLNVSNRRAATATVVIANVSTQAGKNVLQTNGYDGWFLGMALSGAGIPAATVVAGLDPDGRRVFMGTSIGVADKLATATAAISATGTYTGYGAGLIFYPFVQGAIT
jgi:hypothetical protein